MHQNIAQKKMLASIVDLATKVENLTAKVEAVDGTKAEIIELRRLIEERLPKPPSPKAAD